MLERIGCRRPSHTTVVAYLSLFLIVAGGVAYGAGHLGKNSVGPRQLRKNAVRTPKIRNGAVTTTKLADGAVTGAKVAPGALTGAQVDASSLGQVPSAGFATSSADAASLGGVPPSGFVSSGRILFGYGKAIGPSTTIFTIGGAIVVRPETMGTNSLGVEFHNASSEPWVLGTSTVSEELKPGSGLAYGPPDHVVSFFLQDRADPSKQAVLICGHNAADKLIGCEATLSPGL